MPPQFDKSGDALCRTFKVTGRSRSIDLKARQSGTLTVTYTYFDSDHDFNTHMLNQVQKNDFGYMTIRRNLAEENISNVSQNHDWAQFVPKDASSNSPQIINYINHAYSDPTVDELTPYEALDCPDWDGHGANPITRQTLNYARRLLGVMPETLGRPDIAPAADGSIALEWIPEGHHKLDKLFLDIGGGEEWRAYWLLRDGQFGRMTGKGYTVDSKQILHNIFNDLNR